jgi:toxin ParE1/3/4
VSRYLLAPAAVLDLERIWDYTADRWDIDQADTYLAEIRRAIERAAANPRIGRACDEIRLGYRKLPAGSHLVFYRVRADGVIDVIRVLHQRMDIDRHL